MARSLALGPPDRRAVLAAMGLGGLGLGGLGLGGMALTGCSPKRDANGGAAKPLRVGVYRGGAETFLGPAGQVDRGHPLALNEFAAGNLITEAILAKALDIGSMSEIPPIFVAASRPAMRLIAVLKGDVNNQVVLVPKASTITHPADLKGRTVGYVRATTSHYLLLRLLAEHRLTFRDITPVALSLQDGRTAFERGSLDAWVAYGVAAQATRETAGARVLTTGLGRLSGNYVFAAAEDALSQPDRRSSILDYLGRVHRTLTWIETHPDDWARLAAAATGVSAAIYTRQRAERSGPTQLALVDDAAVTSQQAVADGFAAAGVLPARVDVGPLWDRTFAADLAGRLTS